MRVNLHIVPLGLAATLLACPAPTDPATTLDTTDAASTAGTVATTASGGVTTTATDTATGGAGEPSQYCPGAEAWPNGTVLCRTDADCPEEGGQFVCAADGFKFPDLGCGGCVDPCGGDGYPCAAPSFCVDNGPGCCGQCVSDCTMGAMCNPGYECDPNKAPDLDGFCVPIACGAGWNCADGLVCHPIGPGTDAHGCSPAVCSDPEGAPCSPNGTCIPEVGCGFNKPCDLDADCACGTCVGSVCRDRPGQCVDVSPPE